MIEAIVICVQLIGVSLQDCSVWKYDEPLERTPENIEASREECASITAQMAEQGYIVTCEEHVYEEAE